MTTKVNAEVEHATRVRVNIRRSIANGFPHRLTAADVWVARRMFEEGLVTPMLPHVTRAGNLKWKPIE